MKQKDGHIKTRIDHPFFNKSRECLPSKTIVESLIYKVIIIHKVAKSNVHMGVAFSV
jgi:hypothetical protein